MHTFTVTLSLVAAVLAAPSAMLVPRAAVPLGVICTDINFKGSCVTFTVAAPFDAAHSPTGCADMTAPFIRSVSSAHGVTDGYTCFLYSELGCVGERLVISGQIPDFTAPSVNFNDKALSWNCGSALTSV
ncbi:hypothetical protein MVEN_00460900 [Mycena venus]|uniref:Uncharacterized protein n=1 Tax=Mycena venus TaxID=2733690 RepID=A0A8H6YV96_9AGAR|nr:hypothetical protein MVEN_00460900 [Mycena venus]